MTKIVVKNLAFLTIFVAILSVPVVVSAAQDSEACRIPSAPNRTIVNLNPRGNEWLASNKIAGYLSQTRVNLNLSAGTYRVTLHAFDDHATHGGQDQQNERFIVRLFNSGSRLLDTPSSSDIPENRNFWVGTVGTITLNQNSTQAEARHACPGCTEKANSLTAICAGFDLVSEPPPPPNAPTVALTANPSTIQSGNSSTLNWTSTNATSCFASGGPWTGGKQVPSGSESTGTLTQTSTYTITCTNGSQSVSDDATVTVTSQPPNAPTVDLKINGSDGSVTVAYGDSANLTWTSTNSVSCNATGNWTGFKQIPTGSESVGPLFENRTYTITCQNSVGQSVIDTVQAIVTNNPQAPTVDLTANPPTVQSGNSSTLSWASTNASSCYASAGPWLTYGNKQVPSGSESTGVLTQTSTYTITCQNSVGQSVSDSATVTVTSQPPQLPTVDLTANPAAVLSGNSSTLSWTSSNATSCQATGGPWSGGKNVPNGSEQTGALTQTSTYTITCYNSAGSASDSATVSVNQPTLSIDLTANPSSVNQGNSSTLNWTSNGASYCYADGGNDSQWFGNKAVPSGSTVISNIQSTRTYGITCANSVGNTVRDEATITVNQNQITPSVTIYASPNPVQSGTQSRLFWNSSSAISCRASGGPWSGPKNLNDSEYTQALTSATTFSITCQNSTSAEATASVTVGVTSSPTQAQPPTLNFYASPSQVPTGSNSTLYWNTAYVDYCVASDGWSGTKSANGNQQVGPINVIQNYVLTCYGPGGSVTRNTTVTPIGQVLGTLPPTLTIYASPGIVQYGGSSTIYWTAANVDSCYASTDWFGSKPNTGNHPTGPLYTDKTYTLTCVGQGGTITRSATVPVIMPYVPPTYTPPSTPPITGYPAASVEKRIENLATDNSGSSVLARPGNELRYTITVRNTGTLNLNNLNLRDPLSEKVEIKKISDNGTYDYTNRTVTWKISRLTPGESRTYTLLTKVIYCDCERDTSIENRVYLSGGQIGEVVSNNTVAGVASGPFTVSINNPSPTVEPNDKVTYTITYRNGGSETVRGAELKIYVPSGMIIEGYSENCSLSGNTISLAIGDVLAGQSGEVKVIGKIDKGVLDGEQLVTRAVVTYRDVTGYSRESSAQTVSTVERDGDGNVANPNKSGLRFLPDSFFGWLLLLLLIIVLAIFIRRLLTKEK